MKTGRKESFFWTSYSDLMTSMFFVMLVLFVLTIVLLHNKIRATQRQLEKITEIDNSIKQIDTNYFVYNETFKRHTIKNLDIRFQVGSSDIHDIDSSQLYKLYNAGLAIEQFMKRAAQEIPQAQYLLIIEGQSSKDGYAHNYELSYARALTLVNYWEGAGVLHLGELKNCELLISGSGQNSLFRDSPDVPPANQRFVIHIIPKPGSMDD